MKNNQQDLVTATGVTKNVKDTTVIREFLGRLAFGVLVVSAVLFACWYVNADTADKATAQARIEQLEKRTAEIATRKAALDVQYKDVLAERAKWRKVRDAAIKALEGIDKQLEGYVLETERIGIESATSTEEIAWLKERLKEVDQGATDKVALDPATWLQMIADGEIKMPTREER